MNHVLKWGFLLLWVSGCTATPTIPSSIATEEETSEESDMPLTIVAIDVGQGDATLIVSPSGQAVLIDGGPIGAGQAIREALPFSGMEQLAYILTSHYDADHIGGVDEVIAGTDGIAFTADDLRPTLGVLDRGDEDTPQTIQYDDYASLVDPMRQTIAPGRQISFTDGLEMTCIVVNGETEDGVLFPGNTLEENSRSAGWLIRYGDFRYWTGGDLPGDDGEVDIEDAVAAMIGPVELLHTHHHGSKTATGDAFLEVLSPTVALISAGDDNRYGHPASEVIDRLVDAGIDVFATHVADEDLIEDITITGASIVISGNRSGEFSVNGISYGK